MPRCRHHGATVALADKYARLRDLRRIVTGALEKERAEKRIGSSLQATVTIYAGEDYRAALAGVDLAELCIVSGAAFVFGAAPPGAFTLADVPDVGATVTLAPGEKCQRCWRVLPEVGHHVGHDDLCDRCADAVELIA